MRGTRARSGAFLAYQAGIAVLVDAVMVVLFVTYLVAARRQPAAL